MEPLNISVEGFSGPLDLLCSLVESRELEASHIKVTELIRVYGVYLARTQHASVETLAEFFYMVAGLLLEKTRSLLPRNDALVEPPTEEELADVDEGALMEVLERYRPYRAAYLWLAERLEGEERCFRRLPGEDEEKVQDPGDVEYDVCDLYFMCRVWWGIYERYEQARRLRRAQLEVEDAADWDGFVNEPVPDEEQIGSRIAELSDRLQEEKELSLNALCRAEKSSARGIKGLVVTLLALLEMCRMGKIVIDQEALFGDVKILAKSIHSGDVSAGTDGVAVA
ncbi:MAG: segregation/condensation protein A [Synergistaceae bacterium]|nr:segregation/condensation protein A [Synergistaceae bacterium]